MLSSDSGVTSSGSWQAKLQDYCAQMGMLPPIYSIFSDRRGGRTAWSSTVQVDGRYHSARYWFDGPYVNNAKDDAAEVALQNLGKFPVPQTAAVVRRTTDYLSIPEGTRFEDNRMYSSSCSRNSSLYIGI